MTTPTELDPGRDWEMRRARINHDWLRVRFLTFLQAWCAELDRAGESGVLSNNLRVQLTEWQRRRPQLEALLADAEHALSPAHTAGNEVLEALPAKDLDELRESTHKRWLQRSAIPQKLAALQEDIASIDELVTKLLASERVTLAGTHLYETGCKVSEGLHSLGSGADFA